MTFIVGPNNSGKSNILRFLAILLNRAFDRIENREDLGDAKQVATLQIRFDKEQFGSLLQKRPYAAEIVKASDINNISIYLQINRDGISFRSQNDEFDSLFNGYIAGANRHFMSDFSQSGSDNRAILLREISIGPFLNGTTFLPNIRFITLADQEPPQFISWKMPGETLAFGTVIKRLASMDRPDPESRHLRDHKRKIEEFMAYCLEKASVKIEVPDSKKTILVNIDGDERSIDSFGTGVEQLLMIGLASMGFQEKIVLIDEPELNLHPRAQKRIINYLDGMESAQFVIATHSAAILDAAEADIVQVTHSDGGTKSRTIRRNKERYDAVRDLGHSPSDLVQTRFAIWVEGPSDRIYLLKWINKINGTLIEGIDFTILFYGGKVLSHHTFIDDESELVKAVSLSRAFAVIMDSDRTTERPRINQTKTRVKAEIEQEGGYCWITEGREIENYVPDAVITTLKSQLPGVNTPNSKRDQVLDPKKANKVDFARAAVSVETDEWPLDLKSRVTDLVNAIQRAK